MKENKEYPKTVKITFESKELFDFHMDLLLREEKRIKVKLARVILMIDACERNDYSDLSPSMMAELKEIEKQAESQKLLEYQ